MRLRFLLVGLAATTLSGSPTLCQDPPNDEQGLNPTAAYHSNDIDHINMFNRRLVLKIPLLEDHSQRGQLNFTYSLAYTSTGTWWARTVVGGNPVWQPPQRYGIGDVKLIMDGSINGVAQFNWKDDSDLLPQIRARGYMIFPATAGRRILREEGAWRRGSIAKWR